MPLRVSIVNDYSVVVAGLAAILEPYADRVQVVELALDADNQQPVDVALYDSFAAALRCNQDLQTLVDSPLIRSVLVYAFGADQADADWAIAAGAQGYVSKGVQGAELVRALERAASGEEVIVLGDRRGQAMGRWPAQETGLSDRESEMLALITRGMSNLEIADSCHLSVNTVKTYVRTAYRKIGVATRSQAVAWSMRNGLAPEDAGHTVRSTSR